MLIYWLMLLSWLTADLIWWFVGDLRLRRLPGSKLARILLAGFMAFQTSYLLYCLAHSAVKRFEISFAMIWVVCVYVWHLVVLPLAIVGLMLGRVRAALAWVIRRRQRAEAAAPRPVLDPLASTGEIDRRLPPTRRQIMTAGLVAVPPLLTGGLTWQAVTQLREFRVRRVELHIDALPVDLDGLTIAHVTDLHIGPFLPPGKLERVAEATNALEADLIAFTGDLNDQAMRNTRLAADFLRRLAPRHGFAMIEGNHDVMNDTERFEVPILEGGFPLLLDDAMTFTVPGRATPVQLLGISWGEAFRGRQIGRTGLDAAKLYRLQSMEAMRASLGRVLVKRDRTAFPILMAHHPHAFDLAAEAGLPVTLSGHTHGGQVMLTERIGAGPLRFRYWTGLYRKQQSQLFVANGVGAWFPLRLNAPAEIVHLTLRTSRPVPPAPTTA